MQEVVETVDSTVAGGARAAQEAAVALTEALVDAGEGELGPIDLGSLNL